MSNAKRARSVGGPFPDAEPFVSAIIETLRTFETSPLNRERSAPVSPAPEVVAEVPIDAERERLAAIFERDAGPAFVTTTLSHKDQSIVAAALRSSTPVAPSLASAVRVFIANLRADAVRFAEKADGSEFDEKFRHATKAQLTSGHADALEALLVSAPVAPVVEGERNALELNERIWDLARTTIANRIRQVRFEERNKPRLARAAQVLANSAESDLLDLLTTPVVFARTSTDTPTGTHTEAQ